MSSNILKRLWPEKMIFRYSISAVFIVFIAVCISCYSLFSEKFWLPISAVLALQTMVGLAARQGLQRFLMTTLSVLAASYLTLAIKNTIIIDSIAIIFLSVICYFSLMRIRPQLAMPLMMGIVILIAMVVPSVKIHAIHARVLDVMIGGLLGVAGGLFIFPVRADQEFRKEVVPLLECCGSYFQAIVANLYDHEQEKNLTAQRNHLEEIWQEFPDWVYETGFVSSLQAGHRHFLVRIEQIRQILFVLNYLAGCDYDRELLQELKAPLEDYVGHVLKIINSMIKVLTLQQLSEGADDLADSFDRLETAFKELVPYSLESLDINEESVNLANFIYELQELGKMFMILAKTLR